MSRFHSARALATVMQAASVTASMVGSSVPATARLQNMQGGKREPSSFVAESDDIDGERQPALLCMQRSDALDPEQDAEWAVVAPGIAHAVQMAADQQRWRVWLCTGVMADQGAERIDAHLHAGRLHPHADLFHRGAVGRAKPATEQSGSGVARRRNAQRIAARHGTRTARSGWVGGRVAGVQGIGHEQDQRGSRTLQWQSGSRRERWRFDDREAVVSPSKSFFAGLRCKEMQRGRQGG